ncbi:MAG: hypothetical protein M3N08_04025, partial [Pseudomonadota bacterium]|nr:hypothetical protein [Pseudomonadota bacterium]
MKNPQETGRRSSGKALALPYSAEFLQVEQILLWRPADSNFLRHIKQTRKEVWGWATGVCAGDFTRAGGRAASGLV